MAESANREILIADPADAGALEGRTMPVDIGNVLLLVGLVLSLILVWLGCNWWLQHPMLIYCDQGLYVGMADLLLKGRIPYVDMFDVNPPLAIYFDLPPVLASYWLRIPQTLAFSMYVWLLTLISCLLSGWVLLAARRSAAILPAVCALTAFAYFNQIQHMDFGQREHIFCILWAPFFFLRYLRWQGFKLGRTVSIAVGLFAGIGLAFKPHFMVMAAAPELFFMLKNRDLRPLVAPEVLSAVAVILAYLVHFLFLPHAELASFFQFVVPIYKEGYAYYVTSNIFNLATFARNDFFFLICALVGAIALAEWSSLALALSAFACMSALIYVLAGQAWPCHMVAVRLGYTMALFAEAALVCQLLPAFIAGRDKVFASSVIAFVFATAGGGYYISSVQATDRQDKLNQRPYPLTRLGYSGEGSYDDMDPFAEGVLTHTNKDDKLVFICAAMAPGYPVMLQTGRQPGSRFLHGMMLPILSYIKDLPNLSAEKKARFKRDKDKVIAWYGEDIRKYRPKLIYIQDNPMNWVFENSRFVETHMANYTRLEVKDGISIYKRND
jgi:hypothetical protein